MGMENAKLSLAAQGPRLAALDWADHCQVHDVLALYGRLYDDDRIDDFLKLLTPDALFHPNWAGVAPERVAGIADLAAFFKGARGAATADGVQPRHLATNILVAAEGEGRAFATLTMLYVESRGAEVACRMVGQYDYRLVRIDGRWLISEWSMRYDL